MKKKATKKTRTQALPEKTARPNTHHGRVVVGPPIKMPTKLSEQVNGILKDTRSRVNSWHTIGENIAWMEARVESHRTQLAAEERALALLKKAQKRREEGQPDAKAFSIKRKSTRSSK